MKQTDGPFIIIGKIGSSYGTQGWVKMVSYTEFKENILDYQPWYIQQEEGGPWRTLQVEASKPHGRGTVVKLAMIHTPEEARALTGLAIAVERSQLPTLAKNEYYWSDLIGLTVIDQHGNALGKVIYLMETGSNDVLVIKGEKEIAIPYLRGSVVKQIDLEKQTILVDWELI